ncbi:MAG: thermonuclease family protein [Nanoarchaeota archaeon]|nr:thermonuclease family protein [Nanoarchaeota archaeon]
MKPQTKTLAISLVAVLVLAILLYVAIMLLSLPQESEQEIPENTVTRIIDGDTFELASGEVVRLICIDAPELGTTRAEESSDFLFSLIYNKQVRLESDIEDKDAYGRLLRYVYVNSSEGEIFINKALFQEGFASVFRYGNDTAKCDEIENN